MTSRRYTHSILAWIPFVAIVAPVGALSGCATAPPPKELLDARVAYQRAQSGPATELKPAELHVAKESLDRAEAAYNDKPGSAEAIDYAYVAQRKIELAEAQANAAVAMRDKAKAEADAQLAQRGALARTGEELKRKGAELSKTQEQLAAERGKFEHERQARLAAEKKAKETMDALAKSLAVKEEARGTVITLSGSVLFASGQSTLLASAREKLDQVAEALKGQAEHHFTVEGHTDSQGSDKVNQELSQARAETVRAHLISRGVPVDLIKAVGMGPSKPIADNKTPEGRANNRRVEIIVEADTPKK